MIPRDEEEEDKKKTGAIEITSPKQLKNQMDKFREKWKEE